MDKSIKLSAYISLLIMTKRTRLLQMKVKWGSWVTRSRMLRKMVILILQRRWKLNYSSSNPRTTLWLTFKHTQSKIKLDRTHTTRQSIMAWCSIKLKLSNRGWISSCKCNNKWWWLDKDNKCNLQCRLKGPIYPLQCLYTSNHTTQLQSRVDSWIQLWCRDHLWCISNNNPMCTSNKPCTNSKWPWVVCNRHEQDLTWSSNLSWCKIHSRYRWFSILNNNACISSLCRDELLHKSN